MELLKGIVYDHKQVESGELKGFYKALVAFVMISEKPIKETIPGKETLILGPTSRQGGDSPIAETLSNSPLYLPPFPLGTIDHAVLTAAGFNFDTPNLQPLNKLAEFYARGELKWKK